jgi:hypothetical protein
VVERFPVDHLEAVSVLLLDEPSEGVLGLDLVLGVGGPALRQERVGRDLAGVPLLMTVTSRLEQKIHASDIPWGGCRRGKG